jgi:Na+/H+-dicarboxylate symporter
MRRHFTLIIVLGLVAGLGFGWVAHDTMSASGAASLAGSLDLVTGVFITLIKMIIAPLIFATLTSGVARMEGGGRAGRVGGRTIAWFVVAGMVALALGMTMATLIRPGEGLHLPQPADAATVKSDLSVKGFLAHVVPTSIVDAMARNEVLQIVVFSLFAGSAMSALGARAALALELLEQVAAIMLKITGYVMLVAPFAVFAAIASALAVHGAALIVVYARFIGGFYLAIAVFLGLLLAAASVVLRGRLPGLLAAIRQPALLAFSTASSEAAYPSLLDGLIRFGVSPRVAGFVLPLGYSFNLGASMLYTTFAVLFIAQIYGVELTLTQKFVLGGMLFVTSKGIAGVSRASLVVIAAALPYFHLPQSGLLLILAADQLLDMGRSGANVVGNAIAAAAVATWEGELGSPIEDVTAAVEGARA